MILDTSAVIAILQNEESAPRLVAAFEGADVKRISAATLVEAGIILQARYGDHGERELDLFVQRARVEIISMSEEHAEYARAGYRRFGKGQDAAGLNFGDCFAYALARALNEPLLFVGDDFARTTYGWPSTERVRNDRKLDAVRAAARHEFPTADVDAMLAEIERGYLGEPD